LGIIAKTIGNNLNSLFSPAPPHITFVKAGEKVISKSSKNPPGILTQSNDWMICADLDKKTYNFPAHIAQTSLYPDIIVWSDKAKQIVLLELTVPLKENTAGAQVRKLKRYQNLEQACKANGYQAYSLTLEVDSRGWVASSVGTCMRKLGIPNPQIKRLLLQLSNTALHMSYLIYVNRENPS
jgi:hypothetical protein